MSKNQLLAEKRDTSVKPNQLRASGKVPATLYGQGVESISLQMDGKTFGIEYKKDKNAIFELAIGKEKFDSVVKKVQYSNVKHDILNVEFQRINSDVKMRMVIPVEFVGTSAAAKSGGSLVHNMSEIEVECLPINIPHVIKVDVSVLKELEQTITLGQVKLPDGVKATHSKDAIVVMVTAASTVEVAGEGAETPVA